MSDERMSDADVAAWHEAMRFASPPADGSPADRVLKDHLRARRVETEQAEKIKALADALELLRKTAHDDVKRAQALPLVDAVLRKNGRNP